MRQYVVYVTAKVPTKDLEGHAQHRIVEASSPKQAVLKVQDNMLEETAHLKLTPKEQKKLLSSGKYTCVPLSALKGKTPEQYWQKTKN